MDKLDPSILSFIGVGFGLGMVPLIAVTTTAFLKISVVLYLVRNALGTQQTPPNLVLNGVAVVLTIYLTMPLAGTIYGRLNEGAFDFRTMAGLEQAAQAVEHPIHDHLVRFVNPVERDFFLGATRKIWSEQGAGGESLSPDSLLVLVPSFVISELSRAFEIGFLLYLPFIAIDLLISNVLMSMGMSMVSPLVISVPFKLFLFVLINGWGRLLHGLILSYG